MLTTEARSERGVHDGSRWSQGVEGSRWSQGVEVLHCHDAADEASPFGHRG